MSHEIFNINDTLYHSLQYLVRRKHLLELFLAVRPQPADQVNCSLSIPYLLIFIYIIINTGAKIIIYNTNWNNDLEAASSIDSEIDKSSSLIDIDTGTGKIYFWLKSKLSTLIKIKNSFCKKPSFIHLQFLGTTKKQTTGKKKPTSIRSKGPKKMSNCEMIATLIISAMLMGFAWAWSNVENGHKFTNLCLHPTIIYSFLSFADR